jgi:hypothetical protein
MGERDASGSQLFSSTGKPKVFSWGDAALTANITSEKVIIRLHINIFRFLTMYIHLLYFYRQHSLNLMYKSNPTDILYAPNVITG